MGNIAALIPLIVTWLGAHADTLVAIAVAVAGLLNGDQSQVAKIATLVASLFLGAKAIHKTQQVRKLRAISSVK